MIITELFVSVVRIDLTTFNLIRFIFLRTYAMALTRLVDILTIER